MNTQAETQTSKRAAGSINPEHERDAHRRIQAATVRQMCGGISDMSLWRWLDNPELNFPRPIYIGRRRYWKEAEIVAWLEAREVAA